MHSRRWFAFALVAILGCLPLRTSAAEPLEIPVILSLTGPAAFLDTEEQEALRVAERVVNADGGVRGRPIRFTFLDDGSSPQQAVIMANRANEKHPPVILGPGFAATCRAVEPMFAANGPLNYCFAPPVSGPPGSYVFSASFATPDAYAVLMRYLRQRGAHRIALITTTDASGQDGEAGITAAAGAPENRDLAIVAAEHFGATDISVTAQLTRVAAAHPDVLIAWTVGTPLNTVLRGVSDAGLTIPVVTSHGNMTYTQMDHVGALTPAGGLYFASPLFVKRDALRPGPLRRAVDTFYTSFAKYVGHPPDVGDSYSWDPAFIVVDALRHVGPDATAEQLRGYLTTSHGFVGVNGVYDFRYGSQRGLTGNAIIVARWEPQRRTWVAVSEAGGRPVAVR